MLESRLIQVKCTDAIELIQEFPDNSVDLIVADPPYGISYQSNRRRDGKLAPIIGDHTFNPKRFFQEVQRVLCCSGAAYVFTRWDVYPIWASWVQQNQEIALKNLIVWDKGAHTSGDLTGNYGYRHELVMFLVKGRHHLRGKRYGNVWDIPRVAPSKLAHPAEKPVELIHRMIQSSMDPSGVFLDPFCGSGVSGVAAQLYGVSKAVLGDIDPKWAGITQARLGLPVTFVPPVESLDELPPDVGYFESLDLLDGIHPTDLLDVLTYLRGR